MFKGRHLKQSVILLCVRWYLSYGLILGDLNEVMAERGIDSSRGTVEFWLSEHLNLADASRSFRKSFARHGRSHALSSTAIRRTGQRLFPVTPQAAFGINPAIA